MPAPAVSLDSSMPSADLPKDMPKLDGPGKTPLVTEVTTGDGQLKVGGAVENQFNASAHSASSHEVGRVAASADQHLHPASDFGGRNASDLPPVPDAVTKPSLGASTLAAKGAESQGRSEGLSEAVQGGAQHRHAPEAHVGLNHRVDGPSQNVTRSHNPDKAGPASEKAEARTQAGTVDGAIPQRGNASFLHYLNDWVKNNPVAVSLLAAGAAAYFGGGLKGGLIAGGAAFLATKLYTSWDNRGVMADAYQKMARGSATKQAGERMMEAQDKKMLAAAEKIRES